MKTGTTVPYATKRTVDHVTRFTKIYESLMNGSLDEAWLAEVGRRDNPFSEVDYRVYAT
jgi:1,4-alpha-glucan branching enzyme